VLVGDRALTFWNRAAAEDVRFELQFEGANPSAAWQNLEPQPGTTTYMEGNRPERWIHDVPRYSRLVLPNLYRGIDLVLYGAEDKLEYDLVLHPGADPRTIRLRFSGERKLSVAPNGDLVAATGAGELVEHRPVLFQLAADGSRRKVDGGWRLSGRHQAAFRIGRRDKSAPLIIDPVVVTATYLGADNDDRVVAADPRYAIVGTTQSTKSSVADATGRPHSRIFIYNPVTESTSIIGGSGDDVATCAKITGTFIVVGGYTDSRDFPVNRTTYGEAYAPIAPQTQYAGGVSDGFLLEMESPSEIFFATYVGGPVTIAYWPSITRATWSPSVGPPTPSIFR
jgi:hypothetical protein